MDKRGRRPTRYFDLITQDTFDICSHLKFVETFNKKTAAIQGSGWGWLGCCPGSRCLKITTCANQDPLSTQGMIPLLGVDVWEHAYYLQYKNARPEYLKNIWRVVNWKNVEERFENAIK